METTQAVISGGPAASAPPSGATDAAPIQAFVPGSTSADAAPSVPAVKPSRSQKTAANIAAAQARTLAPQMAARPQVLAQTVQPDLAPSPEVASMTPDQIAAAFMGKAVEQPAAEESKGETEETTETAEETTAETETETQADETAATETETNTETASNVSGITKELTEKGVSPKLIKRLEDLAKQKVERGEQLKRQDFKPVVIQPSLADAFSDVFNEADLGTALKEGLAVARTSLRKLSRMDGIGGTWNEGGKNERELTPEDVEQYITHYERVLDEAPAQAEARKGYLKSLYADVAALELPANELINPKVETRESRFIRTVPELTRSHEYLRLLADAKAGREQREKKARGIQTVEIDSAKAAKTTAAPKGGTVPAKQTNSNSSSANPKARTTAPVRSADAGLSLAELRTRAENGNEAAQNEIARRMLAA